MVFVSNKYHCVAPVTAGRRNVLVVELWHGEARCCDHRCVQHWDWGGKCRFVGHGAGDGSGGQDVDSAAVLAEVRLAAGRAEGLES